MNAAFVRELAGKTYIDAFDISFGIKPFDRLKRNAFERLLSLGRFIENLLRGFPLPNAAFLPPLYLMLL